MSSMILVFSILVGGGGDHGMCRCLRRRSGCHHGLIQSEEWLAGSVIVQRFRRNSLSSEVLFANLRLPHLGTTPEVATLRLLCLKEVATLCLP